MQPFCVYVLSCADGALYIGHTDDLERRIAEHQSGEIPGFTPFDSGAAPRPLRSG